MTHFSITTTMSNNSFIGTYDMVDPAICDKIIDHFESSPAVTPGGFMTDQSYIIDHKRKHCDQTFFPSDSALWYQYAQQLQTQADQYIAQYPWCNSYEPWKILEPVQIQRYLPGQAYHDYHTERTGSRGPQAVRHLVFMTYLNTVTNGGGTEWPQQNILTAASRGCTVIWPADWTHTHRGVVSSDQTKYIVTGWFSFY